MPSDIMKKSIISILSIVSVLISSFSISAVDVPRESAPCNASSETIVFVESYIGDILTEVQNGLGYADARARAKSLMRKQNSMLEIKFINL